MKKRPAASECKGERRRLLLVYVQQQNKSVDLAHLPPVAFVRRTQPVAGEDCQSMYAENCFLLGQSETDFKLKFGRPGTSHDDD